MSPRQPPELPHYNFNLMRQIETNGKFYCKIAGGAHAMFWDPWVWLGMAGYGKDKSKTIKSGQAAHCSVCCLAGIETKWCSSRPGLEVEANISLSYQETQSSFVWSQIKNGDLFPASETVLTVEMLSLHFCVAFFELVNWVLCALLCAVLNDTKEKFDKKWTFWLII